MFSLTSFVLISLAFVGSVNASDCPVESLVGLASNSNLAGCTEKTGISISTIGTLTQDQIMSACESAPCMALMSDIASLGLGDCTIPGSNVSVQSGILDSFDKSCGASRSMGSMDMAGSSSSKGTTNVGDSSADSSSTSDKVTGEGSSGSSNAAATVAVGCISTFTMVAITFLL